MPRPPLPLETWGKIRRATINGQPVAFAYYRDAFGKRRPMQRNGRTEPEAERNLLKALRERIADTADGELLTRDTTVRALGAKWLDELKMKGTPSGTYNTYRAAVNRLTSDIGDLRLGEAAVPRIDRYIKSRIDTPAYARTTRTVLLQMFAMAVRQGAIPSNPVPATMPISPRRKVVKVISLADIQAMRLLFVEYDAHHISELYELSAMLMATGCRIGEELALDWEEDVNLATGVLGVNSTLVVDSDSGKLIRQPYPKSEASERGLTLPATVLTMLVERRVASHHEIVFPSATGTYRWPANVRRQWRDALAGTPYVGKTPRDFRKAVATHLDRQIGIKAAAAQLGHGSEDITTTYYVERQKQIADFADVLETMFAESDTPS